MTNFEKDKIAIHNLISHKGLIIDQRDQLLFEKITQNPDDYSKLSYFHILCEKGMIIKNEINEINEIEKLKTKELEKKQSVLSLTIIPTYQCNFKCVYCWEKTKDSNDSMNKETQFKLLEFIERKIESATALDIDWFGGEPLIAFDAMKNLLDKIAIICKNNKKPYTCSLTTNGYGLTIDKFEYLLKHNTRFFQITVDGNKDLHDRNRPLKSGGGTYDVILNNLKNIRNHATRKYFRFLIRLNVTEETYQKSNEYLEMIEQEFVADERFQLYIQAVETHHEVRKTEMTGKYLSNHEITEQLYDLCIEKDIKTSTLKMLYPGDLMCKSIHENTIFINSEGGIYKCDMKMEKEDSSYLGSVFDEKTKSKLYSDWGKSCKKNDYCDTCVLLPLCFGLKCPFYNTAHSKYKCELYNNLPLVKNAIKTYAQHNKYELLNLR